MPLYNIITSVSLCAEFLTRPRLLPTNILPALIKSAILKKTIEALHTTTFPARFLAKRKKNNIPFQQPRLQLLTLYCTGKINKLLIFILSPPYKKYEYHL